MRESINNSMIFTWVMTFVAIIMTFLIGSMAYSKAYKIKSNIIGIIEKHEGYTVDAKNEINTFLNKIGYRHSQRKGCDEIDGFELMTDKTTQYRYCVYKNVSTKGSYYRVVAYMYFDVPFAEAILEFPVAGESKVIYDLSGL